LLLSPIVEYKANNHTLCSQSHQTENKKNPSHESRDWGFYKLLLYDN